MDFLVIIPAHNEEAFIGKTLQSLVEQSFLPKKIVVVNDNSTDGTQQILDSFSEKFPFIKSIIVVSEGVHEPGSKIINAFNKGLESINQDFDIICKFDSDLIFPKHYLKTISGIFKENQACGMAGGFCYIENNNEWALENLTNKDHIRGALKAYRKECFEKIRGLKNTMGWDTVDELLAQYHGFTIKTDETLHVKHLKPTGKVYTKAAKYKQGEAFYKMRYGFWLTIIASAKLAVKKNSFPYFIDCLKGYFKSKNKNLLFMVSEDEGKFIRNLRWQGIKSKFF